MIVFVIDNPFVSSGTYERSIAGRILVILPGQGRDPGEEMG